jgi:acetolactate decarboxylase
MKKVNVGVLGLLMVFSAAPLLRAQSAESPRELYQVSTLDTLLTGDFEGSTTVETLLQHGNLGIGTFTDLDGELVLLEGTAYQIKSDGKVYPVAPAARVPFAMVGQFISTQTFTLDTPLTEKQLAEFLDAHLPKATHYFLIKVSGEFDRVKARSVPRQAKPYPPLEKVIPKQSVFELSGVSGTLVGWRSPQFLKSVSGAGNHFHFINSAKNVGGHALEYTLRKGTLEVEEIRDLHLVLPDEGKVYAPASTGGPKQP